MKTTNSWINEAKTIAKKDPIFKLLASEGLLVGSDYKVSKDKKKLVAIDADTAETIIDALAGSDYTPTGRQRNCFRISI